MRESTIEAYFKRRVKEAGGLTRKFVSPGRRSVPDQIVLWPCAIVDFVELKAPSKQATAAQLREHARLHRMGCVVHVLTNKELIDKYVGGRI